jgi:hypothetical protein
VRTWSGALIALVAFACLAASPSAAQQQTAWPRTYDQAGAKVVVYQPQVEAWPGYTVLRGMAAVAVTPAGAKRATYGSATFTAFTDADFQTGDVTVTDPRITGTRWPGESSATSASLDRTARSAVQLTDTTIPLASVLASLDAAKALPSPVAVANDPPAIDESEQPAILVVFDRDPIFAPIEGTDLKFAVNTNWTIVYDGSLYYLLDAGHWLSAPSVNGPWRAATAPASFRGIPDNANWADVHNALGAPAPVAPPRVFVNTQPTDLIAIDGAPTLVALPPTRLQYVSNSANDLFYLAPSSEWFVLLSGRWYRAASLSGPWIYASDALPPDFAKIPLNSPRGSVLVSVPGTAAAQYAGASAQVPQIASVDPSKTQLTVSYNGQPEFQPIAGTALFYAVNTPNDVVKINETTYYACESGIWFVASSPTGPWAVARSVPAAIYTIPPNSPLYADTYVHVYAPDGTIVTTTETIATPSPYAATTEVLSGFTLGYLSYYWANGGWVYGTGYYWPGYYWPSAIPIYYPYPWTWTGGWARTWAGGTYYNSATGAYGRWGSVYGPYGGAAYRAQYNPNTGTYARGAAAYGPNGAVAAGGFYNPRYGVAGRTVQGTTPYGSWGHSAVTTRYGSAVTGHASNANGSVAGIATRNGASAVGKAANGDVYAGHDGNVYRNQNGAWQKSEGGGNWSPVTPPGGLARNPQTNRPQQPMGQSNWNDLNRDAQARRGQFNGFRGGGAMRGGFRR